MCFAPYIAEVFYAFSKTPRPYTKINLQWSESGLLIRPPAAFQYFSPGSEEQLTIALQDKPVFGFLDLPDNQAATATLSANFSNGSRLEKSAFDILYSAFLAELHIQYFPEQDETAGQRQLAASLSWQIDSQLVNQVDHYILSSSAANEDFTVGQNADCMINALAPNTELSVTLSAIGFNGKALGTLTFNLYAPLLIPLPSYANKSTLGYGRQMDSNGVQESHSVNHDLTIGQISLPIQPHAADTKTLGAPLSLLNPATVVSGDASEYVNTFDPSDHNAAFDYSVAKAKSAESAPRANAILSVQHQGDYMLEHQGILNEELRLDQHTESLAAPQINITVENYQGDFSGNTFNKTVNNYYEQTENETSVIHEHSFSSPIYNENVNSLQEQVNSFNLGTQSMNMQGNVLSHNGTVYTTGNIDIGYSGGVLPAAFSQEKRAPKPNTRFQMVLPQAQVNVPLAKSSVNVPVLGYIATCDLKLDFQGAVKLIKPISQADYQIKQQRIY